MVIKGKPERYPCGDGTIQYLHNGGAYTDNKMYRTKHTHREMPSKEI